MIIKLTLLLFLSLSYSTTILVPSEYPTIQSAIDAPINGDTCNDYSTGNYDMDMIMVEMVSAMMVIVMMTMMAV